MGRDCASSATASVCFLPNFLPFRPTDPPAAQWTSWSRKPFAVRFSQTLEFDRRPCVMFEFGDRNDYFLLPWEGWWQGGGEVVARWWQGGGCSFLPGCPNCRLEICQIFYTTRFSGQKFYTVKTRILRLFLLTIKQRRCHYQLVLSFFLLKLKWICKYSTVFEWKCV